MQHINGSFDKKKYPGCRGTRYGVEAWGGVLANECWRCIGDGYWDCFAPTGFVVSL